MRASLQILLLAHMLSGCTMLPAIDLSGTARPSAERAFAESRLTLDLFVDVCIEHAKDHAYAKSVGENLGLTQKRDLPQNN